jgi:hypothetical protein
MPIPKGELPSVVSVLVDKVNYLTAIVDTNNKLQNSNGFFTARILNDFFNVTPRILKLLLTSGKIKEYYLENQPVYKISEIWETVQERKREKEVVHE